MAVGYEQAYTILEQQDEAEAMQNRKCGGK
jgi:hypothetical protein